jgi:hypothetical protein
MLEVLLLGLLGYGRGNNYFENTLILMGSRGENCLQETQGFHEVPSDFRVDVNYSKCADQGALIK